MATPYIGEVRIFGFTFAPIGWAHCDGQLMAIAQNQALFAILGTTFGGDGQSSFGLPNMQGNAPMHWGNGPGLTPRVLGEKIGEASVTLTVQEMPSHNHMFTAAQTPGDSTKLVPTPTSDALLSSSNPGAVYSATTTPAVAFSSKAIGFTGQSQPHNNLQPLLVLNYCIALEGIFPSRN
jgi:microcystin-dependent protein